MSEARQTKNVVAARIDANGNVIVGDGNTIINLKEAAQYIGLKNEIQDILDELEEVNIQIEKNPENDYFRVRLLKISKKWTQKQKDLETLKQEVLKLADEFTRIPINTKRLRLAKLHFDKGEFKEARAVLDSDLMSIELDALLLQKENLQQKASENQRRLSDKANEYFILAQLTGFDFEIPDRFEKTKEYFERALSANRSVEIIFGYAYYLKQHYHYQEAQVLYEEALHIYRQLAKADLVLNQPRIAGTLNNLARLYKQQNNFTQSKIYFEESLQIRRLLVESDPYTHTPDLATTLDNLGNLYQEMENFNEAFKHYKEALKIREALSIQAPQTYLYDYALSLNNFALLHIKIKKSPLAYKFFQDVLTIYKNLQTNSNRSFEPEISNTLNNLGGLCMENGFFYVASQYFEDALIIRKRLYKINFETNSIHISKIALNLALLYKQELPDREKSLAYCREAIRSAVPFIQQLHTAQQIILKIEVIIKDWGENIEEFYIKAK